MRRNVRMNGMGQVLNRINATERFEMESAPDDMAGLHEQVAAIDRARKEVKRLQTDLARRLAVVQDDLTCQIRSRFQLMARLSGSELRGGPESCESGLLAGRGD